MQPDPLSQAIEHFRSGRLDEAEERCRVVLGRDPEHAEANHLLGAMRFQQGKIEEALAFLKRAAASPRATAEMHNHLGSAFNRLGRKDEAAQAFERALAINPGYADALHNLGVIYSEKQKTEQAINAFRQAVALKPDLLQVNPNLRSIYHGVVPGWHFQMMDDPKRNETYEAAIRRAAPGKRVLDIGTGAGLRTYGGAGGRRESDHLRIGESHGRTGAGDHRPERLLGSHHRHSQTIDRHGRAARYARASRGAGDGDFCQRPHHRRRFADSRACA